MGRPIWKKHGMFIAALVGVTLLYLPDSVGIWDDWMDLEEFSHGPLMLAVALYLLWCRRALLVSGNETGSWLGLVPILVAVPVYLLALKSGILSPRHYSYLLLIYGMFLFAGGRQFGRLIFPSLLLLLFVIPLPTFLNSNLTWGLQLFSSDVSVGLLRAVGVSVFQDGNVIDLGIQKLEVAEACAGLRYLYPTIGLGILIGMLFNISHFKRVFFLLIASAVSVMMNVVRIFLTGLFVDITDLSVSDGFFHLFEGWVFFVVSFGIILGLCWLILTREEWDSIGNGLFVVKPADLAAPSKNSGWNIRGGVLLLAVVLLAPAFVMLRNTETVIPDREPLLSFPLNVDGLPGKRGKLSQVEIDVLQMTDYFVGRYTIQNSPPLSLFIGYFESQSANQSPHSPRVCIPGGGWQIISIENRIIEHNGKRQPINRVLIQKGDYRQLVYYWFRQRGKNIAGEYEARFDLFLGSITSSRSDGSLIRLVLPIRPNTPEAVADKTLTNFAQALYDILPKYIPD